ncbi:MAG: class II glutamine amidotransferase [Nitriliruptoraceae bacterium]
MCRLAGYVGVPRTLDALLYEPARSLHEQAYAPREQVHGTVNVDGTGVAWWPDHGPGPLRYATTLPPWSDDNLRELAPALRARAMIAAVRGATFGVAGGRGAVAPFVLNGLAIAHNGWLGDFRQSVGPRLVADLDPHWVARLETFSDSLLIALHLACRRQPDVSLSDTVAATVRHIATICRELRQPATLNLLVSDGRQLVATRASVDSPYNSLYTLTDGDAPWSDGALIASEPLDDQPWQPVLPDHLVEVSQGSYGSQRLGLGPSG